MEGAVAADSISRSGHGCPDLNGVRVSGLSHGTGAPMLKAQDASAPSLSPLPPRQFLCALCRCTVLICSHCDRGQRYCSAACSRQARSSAQRAAGKRYQDSRKGRHAHARRQGQWRARHKIVTHQGSPPPSGADVLPGDETAVLPADAQRTCTCHFCGRTVSISVRQGFLGVRFRHPSKRTPRSADCHDHYP